ncbi:2-phosphosulfolactate phosphatase [Priestia megaterium]|uniref:2-phosphosulfolactate phosphatase n=1 Tax=Priestia megaterium TaxID=1404 RepID=UPI00094CC8EF|nr:2-phosphosulfolactate phosphatase [Priestia megaterium]MED4027552.1 2-phosphosulfolactate phosphatase [Priestia megaterium]MED4139856.1 2-phosphosulfolactate phosphatase [Priestia megaterium]OLO39570.1 2-phosphosulfolactate phosphatase [Priestia megaterium]
MKGKIHVILKKEELLAKKLEGKTVVIFDVLLATSTIAAALQQGAIEVIPVKNEEEAREKAKAYKPDDIALVGEYREKTIEGFFDPNPSTLKEHVQNKTVILSTTNGTVAIHNAEKANHVYTASLLNGEAVASAVCQQGQDETVLLVCSGSANRFCLEDLYGAGYFISCLLQLKTFHLTDAAKAGLLLYEAYEHSPVEILKCSAVGEMLTQYGFLDEIGFVSRKNVYPVVPKVVKKKLVNGEETICLK